MLNHIPLFGLLFGGGLLLYALARGSDLVTRIAMVFFLIGDLGAGDTYLTGEGPEEVVKDLSGGDALGAFSLLFLFWYRDRSIPRAVSAGLLVLVVTGIGAVGYTAYTGGQINHPELRGELTSTRDVVSPEMTAKASKQSPLRVLKYETFLVDLHT